MGFAEVINKAMELTRKDDNGYFFQFALLGAEKSTKNKNASAKIQLSDDIVQHLFDNLNKEVCFVLCFPRDIWNQAIMEVRE